jgi:hypothetical protein
LPGSSPFCFTGRQTRPKRLLNYEIGRRRSSADYEDEHAEDITR